MGIRITGDREMKKKLLALARKYPEAAAAALYQEGVSIMGDAVRRAPVEYGVLRRSGYCAPPPRPDEALVTLGFGANYAIYVHERTELRHPRGGEAKFLERAIYAAVKGFSERMARRIRELVESGRGFGVATSFPTRPQVTRRPPSLRRKRRR